jgi:hypothetical protein
MMRETAKRLTRCQPPSKLFFALPRHNFRSGMPPRARRKPDDAEIYATSDKRISSAL